MTLSRLRAVLFDAVGTLIALREPVGDTYARFAAEVGLRVAPDDVQAEFARQMRARRAPAHPHAAVEDRAALERAWWRDLVYDVLAATAARTLVRDFDAAFARLYEHYATAAAWTATPGSRQLLGELRDGGLRLAVVSNFDHRLHNVLRELQLRAFFDIVVLPGDAGAAKPDPAIFHLALRRLQIAANAVLYVGDDPEEDIAAARAAGMTAVQVDAERGFAPVRRAVADRNRD